MLINIKQKFIEMLPASSAPEGFLNFLNNLNDNDYIFHITIPSSSVTRNSLVVGRRPTTYKNSIHHYNLDFFGDPKQILNFYFLKKG